MEPAETPLQVWNPYLSWPVSKTATSRLPSSPNRCLTPDNRCGPLLQSTGAFLCRGQWSLQTQVQSSPPGWLRAQGQGTACPPLLGTEVSRLSHWLYFLLQICAGSQGCALSVSHPHIAMFWHLDTKSQRRCFFSVRHYTLLEVCTTFLFWFLFGWLVF